MHVHLGYASSWDPRRCKAERPIDWRTAAVAVEFHGYSKQRYWSTLLPALAQLRQRYAAANGTLRTATMLREPVSSSGEISNSGWTAPWHRVHCSITAASQYISVYHSLALNHAQLGTFPTCSGVDREQTLFDLIVMRLQVHHLISSYHMWPPNTIAHRGARKQVVPLPEWVSLQSASGLQARPPCPSPHSLSYP